MDCLQKSMIRGGQHMKKIYQKYIGNPSKIGAHVMMHFGGQHDLQNPVKFEHNPIKNRHQNRSNFGMHVDVGLIGILSPTWADLGPT